MEEVILVIIIIVVLLVVSACLSSVGTAAVSTAPVKVENEDTPVKVEDTQVKVVDSMKVEKESIASSDHYPEPSGTIDDGTEVVAIEDLPNVAQKSEQVDWIKDGGKTIVDLGASCGEIKAFSPTKVYPGESNDQYANYCNSMHANRECQDRTCSVPLIMYACRDGCTDGLTHSERESKIGKGAGRITYAEYRAWKEGKTYPGSGASTWKEHCVWKDALGFEGLDAGAEPCTQ